MHVLASAGYLWWVSFTYAHMLNPVRPPLQSFAATLSYLRASNGSLQLNLISIRRAAGKVSLDIKYVSHEAVPGNIYYLPMMKDMAYAAPSFLPSGTLSSGPAGWVGEIIGIPVARGIECPRSRLPPSKPMTAAKTARAAGSQTPSSRRRENRRRGRSRRRKREGVSVQGVINLALLGSRV